MRKIALVLTVLLILSAGAAYAAPGEMESPLLTTYDLMASANKQLMDAKSFEADASLDFAMSGDGEIVKLEADIAMKFMLDPITMKLAMDMAFEADSDSQKMKMDAYLREEDGELVLYGEYDGEAGRIPLGMSSELFAELYAQGVTSELSTSPFDYKELAYIGESTVNGRSVYVIEAKLNLGKGSQMERMMKSIDPDSLMSSSIYSGLIAAMEDMSFICYIDQKTYQYARMEIDCTAMLNKLFKSMDTRLEYDINVEKYSATIDFKNIDKVKKFDVPQSLVKKAQKNDLGDLGIVGGSDGPTSIYGDYDDYYDAYDDENREYYDKIDWSAIAELEEADLEKYIDGSDVDFAKLAKDYPAA